MKSVPHPTSTCKRARFNFRLEISFKVHCPDAGRSGAHFLDLGVMKDLAWLSAVWRSGLGREL